MAKQARRSGAPGDRSKRVLRADQPARSQAPSFFKYVLAGGILVRVAVFAYMGYFNNDNHLAVIDYVARHWSLPRADQFNQAYHPPLYYLLAAPLLRLGGLVAVQALSLFFSVSTLFLIAASLRQLPWVRHKIQLWCVALAAFHPQFILFSLFISNDALAIFLGALIFYQSRRVQLSPSISNVVMLGIWLGLGLLSKAVFLVFIAPLIFFVWLTGQRQALSSTQMITRLAALAGVAAVLGSYKYIESALLFGNPTISNLDFGNWIREQQPTWRGLYSLFDFNLLKLIRDPVISASTAHSYPLMIYGSFWYALIPESTFQGNLISPFHRIGSMIYIVALVPTFLMVVGATRMGTAALGFDLSAQRNESRPEWARVDYEGILLLIFLLNLMLIIAVGWKYDVWSVFQGRLLFPSYLALLLALSAGLEWAPSSLLGYRVAQGFMSALIALFLLYFLTEIWLASAYPIDALRIGHVPFKIDMNAR